MHLGHRDSTRIPEVRRSSENEPRALVLRPDEARSLHELLHTLIPEHTGRQYHERTTRRLRSRMERSAIYTGAADQDCLTTPYEAHPHKIVQVIGILE